MPSRQTLFARKIRAELILQLGGKCKLCAETDPDKLEFDHPDGRDYETNKLSYCARLARYRREAAEGLIRLLCGTCNKKIRKKNDTGVCVPTNCTPELTMELPFGD